MCAHAQALCAAMGKEAESETHFKAVAVVEAGRLQQEIIKLNNEMEALRKKKEAQKVNLVSFYSLFAAQRYLQMTLFICEQANLSILD